MTGPRAAGAPVPTPSRPPSADADEELVARPERHGDGERDGDGESVPAAALGAPHAGATDGVHLEAVEAGSESPIPENVELATGPIPTDLFEAVEDPREPAAAPSARPGGTSAARQRGRSAGLTSALLGGGASAEEAPDALRDTVAAIEELFPGRLVASASREDADPDADPDAAPDADAGAEEAADRAADHESQPDEGDAGAGGAGAAGLFDVDDGAQAPRNGRAPAGRRTTPDRSEAG